MPLARPVDYPALYVRKTANESVTSSATLQDDDHLLLQVAANAAYLLELFLVYDGATTGDIQIGFTFPAGATIDWTPGGLTTGATQQSGSVKLAHVSTGAGEGVGAVGTGAGNRVVARATGILQVAGTAGTLQLQWAQLASDATATTVLANSWMRLQRVV
jgi:hypothetical protein